MDARKFGVEIECGINSANYDYDAYDYGYGNESMARHILEQASLGEYVSSYGYDGSGVEIRTVPLQGKEGFDALRKIMEALTEHGAYVTRSDGLHVHHDAPEFRGSSQEAMDNRLGLKRSWEDNEEIIEKFVQKWRRGYSCCPKVKKDNNYYDGEREALNLEAIYEHGTIEFRLHEGTLDPDEAIAWIKFGQKLIAGSLKRKNHITCADSPERLLKRLRVGKAASARLLYKAEVSDNYA